MSVVNLSIPKESQYLEIGQMSLDKQRKGEREQIGRNFCQELDKMRIHYIK